MRFVFDGSRVALKSPFSSAAEDLGSKNGTFVADGR
jgi:hypothetical protein